jgi:hypothetical protein
VAYFEFFKNGMMRQSALAALAGLLLLLGRQPPTQSTCAHDPIPPWQVEKRSAARITAARRALFDR